MSNARTVVANPFNELTLEQLRRRINAKWRYFPEDVLPLWVAEMDAPVAPPIVDAVLAALANGGAGYPYSQIFAEALASFAADRWGWTFDPATAAQVTDVMTGILEICRIIGRDDGAIVVTPPVYPPFYMVAKTLGRTVVPAPLDQYYRLDPDAIEAAFKMATADGRSAILLLSNPHNPTGTVHARSEFETVADLARQYGVRVIADEIHAPLIMPTSTFTPYLSVSNTSPDFAVVSGSKGWNLAGFKAAVAVPGDGAADDLAMTHQRAGNHAGHMGLIAHAAAYTHARDWLDAAIVGIDENRRALADLLRAHLPAARYRMPEGTYLAWIDCRDLGLGDDPAKVFLDQGRVALTAGLGFGDGGAGFVRLNLATSPAILAEAVTRMASVVSTTKA